MVSFSDAWPSIRGVTRRRSSLPEIRPLPCDFRSYFLSLGQTVTRTLSVRDADARLPPHPDDVHQRRRSRLRRLAYRRTNTRLRCSVLVGWRRDAHGRLHPRLRAHADWRIKARSPRCCCPKNKKHYEKQCDTPSRSRYTLHKPSVPAIWPANGRAPSCRRVATSEVRLSRHHGGGANNRSGSCSTRLR